MCNDPLFFFLLCTNCSFRSVPVSKTVGKALPERLRDGETAEELSIPHSGIPAVLIVYVNHVNREFNAMFIQHQITFAPPRNSCWIRLLFTHTNDCGGAISVTEQRSCAAPISKVGCDISDRVWAILSCSMNTCSTRSGSKIRRREPGTKRDGSNYSGGRTGLECIKHFRPTVPAWNSMCVKVSPVSSLFILWRIAFRPV